MLSGLLTDLSYISTAWCVALDRIGAPAWKSETDKTERALAVVSGAWCGCGMERSGIVNGARREARRVVKMAICAWRRKTRVHRLTLQFRTHTPGKRARAAATAADWREAGRPKATEVMAKLIATSCVCSFPNPASLFRFGRK